MFTELFKYPKTFASIPDDFTYWHHGRKKYAVWAIEPHSEVLLERFESARGCLKPFVLHDNPRQIHVTLGQCGFIAEDKQYDDDYNRALFEADIEKLKKFERNHLRFGVQGVLTSYAIAPFFPILDTHQDLVILHRELTHTANENYEFTPHITVSLYADEWATSDVHQSLIQFPKLDDLSFEIKDVKLFSYDPEIIGGTLTEEACFNLETKQYSVVEKLFG